MLQETKQRKNSRRDHEKKEKKMAEIAVKPKSTHIFTLSNAESNDKVPSK